MERSATSVTKIIRWHPDDDSVRQPVTPPPRPIEAFVHGLSSPVALIEGPEAVALLGYCDMATYLREHRGVNPALDRAIGKLRLLSAAYRAGGGCAVATSRARPGGPVPPSGERLTTNQVALLAGVSRSAVTKAIRQVGCGRSGSPVDGWSIPAMPRGTA
ncbi:MAG: hypothetical protein ACRDRU_27355 [Pseudonocardiaceae bacterium]